MGRSFLEPLEVVREAGWQGWDWTQKEIWLKEPRSASGPASASILSRTFRLGGLCRYAILLGDAREVFFQDCGLPSVPLAARLDQIGQEAVLSKLADSTRRSGTFMSGTAISP